MSRKKAGLLLVSAVSLCSLALADKFVFAKEKEQNGCRQREFGRFSDWSEPVNLGPTVNSPYRNEHPAISNNGLSLYISSNRPGGFSKDPAADDIWVSQRASVDAPWREPQNLGPNIKSAGGSGSPNLSADGHWLYFNGVRPGGCGGFDLWVSHREDTDDDFGWESPANLSCQIYPASGVEACAPTIFEDARTGITTLYFCRSAGGLGDFDIYVSTLRRDGLFGRAALA